MKRRLHFSALTAGVLSLIMLALVAMSSFFTYWYFRSKLESSILSSMDGVVENNSRAAADLVGRVQACMDLFPDSRNDTLNALLFYDRDLYKTLPYYQRIQYKLDNYLRTMVGSEISQSMILFIVDDSMPLSAICTAQSPSVIFSQTFTVPLVLVSRSAKFMTEDFYQRALEADGKAHWFTLPESAGMLYAAQRITQTRLAYSRVKTYDMGVMMIGFSVDWIRDQMSNSVMMQDAYVFITSEDTVIYDSDGRYAGADFSGLVEMSEPETDGRTVCLFGGAGCYQWRTSLDDGLTLITLVPRARIQDLAFSSLRVVLIQMVAILLVILTAIILLVRRLLSPIRQLSDHMQHNVLETVAVPAMARRTVEMNTLYESFNDQTLKINQLMDDVRAIEEEKRRQDIRLLQAQINPHFIYNTLDSVSCMALISGSDEIAGVLGDLASIMRYNLKNPEQLVPFSMEIQMVESYLAIQRVRCAEGIDVSFDLDETAMNWTMPKMSVQPLVENAIVHVKGMPHIRISSHVSEGTLTICIANQSAADPDQIMRHLSGDISISSRSTGLGIRNVNQRIRMIYGPDFGLRYESRDGWLCALLTLPGSSRV